MQARNIDSRCLNSVFQHWACAEASKNHRIKESYTSCYLPDTLVEPTGRPVRVNKETVDVVLDSSWWKFFSFGFGKAPVSLRIYSRDFTC